MDARDRAVRAGAYRALIAGKLRPGPGDIAAETDLDQDEVIVGLHRLGNEHRLVIDDAHRVLMAHPFSGIATGYRAVIKPRSWYGNCAWDALAILSMLGDGEAIMTSPLGKGDLHFRVIDGTVTPFGLVHLVVPPRNFWADIEFT